MTKDKKAKQAARLLKASSNVPYTVARRRAAALARHDQHPFPTLDSLLVQCLQESCAELVQTTVESLGKIDVGGVPGLTEATVRDLIVELSTIDMHQDVDEEYDAITDLFTVTVLAEMFIDGHMANHDATESAGAGRVEIVEPTTNRGISKVAVYESQTIQLAFAAIITSDAESVDGFDFIGAMNLV